MEMRAGYKQTELGVTPVDWDIVSIGILASFTSGKGIAVAALKPQSSEAPVPVYGGNGIAGYTSNSFIEEPVVVVGRVGQKCGEVYLTQGPSWITDNALYPRTIYRSIDIRYLALALKAAGLNGVKNRNDLPLVTQAILHSVHIALPSSRVEQEIIATAILEMDELLDAQKRLIAKKRDIKQAAMQQFLTGKLRLPGFGGEWKNQSIRSISDYVDGALSQGGEDGYIEIGDIDIVQKDYDILDKEKLSVPGSVRVPAGTLLISTVRPTRGAITITKEDAYVSSAFCRLKPKNSYLFYLVCQEKFLAYLGENSIGGTYPTCKDEVILQYSCLMPSTFEEQDAIAAVLSDMDAELTVLERRRDKTLAIKQGMMQELLTGRIRLV